MLNFILTVVENPTGIDLVLEFIKQYLLPIANTILVTVVPTITPYLMSRVNSKINNITGQVDNRIESVINLIDKTTNAISQNITALEVIPAKIQFALTPVLTGINEVVEMILLLSENSRIPSETKQVFKGLHEKAQLTNTLSSDLIKEYETRALTAEQELNIYKERFAKLETALQTPAAPTKSNKKNKRTNKW